MKIKSKFHSYVIKLQKKYNFEPSQIANMAEVPLNFDMSSNKTVDMEGIKTVAIKISGLKKIHYTDVLSFSPMLIFKRKTYLKETMPCGVLCKFMIRDG